MRLIVLGCSGSGPGPESPASGYLVEAGGTRLTLDLGNGTLGALQRHLDPWSLDAVVFSHLHADHCSDFASLVVHRRYHPRPPFDAAASPLPVYAPAGAHDRFARAYAPSDDELAGTDLTDVFTFHDLAAGGTHTIGTGADEVRVSAFGVVHPCPAFALRIEHGRRVLTYSGDTGACPGLLDAARDADLLLCEASWPHGEHNPPGVHLSGREAGEHAATAGARRLVVTHVPAWYDRDELAGEAAAAFDGPVEAATPDAVFDV
ncbi:MULTISPECIES: MBL fold metallo-hydrolase [Pseudonocardia]|uniref:Ribonuclease BN n=2 Tax=Pseudonocardia TaxID=1847 RepID=A0A1Y2MNL2_PSEAH|nr:MULTISPECIES: MBL fold metallo-hydrolase [Pseudonocardia]OSY36569.1 Ribonuclease BN [Pseudonocardia autotrophica]TDN76249.1 ribonuclease BN (tRNA processing enzyme) [Pseudonocardia autotrophica]BBG00231.1 MBL fold metallo-hydrolase [Pseudonocardia autotrophica]GEC28724.1 MBL fold metallo-hydrolase [Pseudonocardia saturnea]